MKTLSKENFVAKVNRMLKAWVKNYKAEFAGFDIENSSVGEQIEFIVDYVGLMILEGFSEENLKSIRRFLDLQAPGNDSGKMELSFSSDLFPYATVMIDDLSSIDVANIYHLIEFEALTATRRDNRIWTKEDAKDFIAALKADLEFDNGMATLSCRRHKSSLRIRCQLSD